jgi:hypothetical protein
MKQLALLFALFGMQGCLYMTAAHSTAGRAYVIRNELVGSSYWNCYANGGDPVCYQVTKVDANAKIAALDSQPGVAQQKPAAAAEPVKQSEPVAAAETPAPATTKKQPAAKNKQAAAGSTRKSLATEN